MVKKTAWQFRGSARQHKLTYDVEKEFHAAELMPARKCGGLNSGTCATVPQRLCLLLKGAVMHWQAQSLGALADAPGAWLRALPPAVGRRSRHAAGSRHPGS